MKNFEDLKSDWNDQSEIEAPISGSKDIIKSVLFVKRKQLITNGVLGCVAVVLVSFFFYIKAYRNTLVAVALLLMIGSLIVRILIEYVSSKKLKKINIGTNMRTYKDHMIDYHKKRIKIHYVFTPIIVVFYITGFIMLLPFFKEELSAGFNTYIRVSGVIIFIVLTFFIRKEILKELRTLKELCN